MALEIAQRDGEIMRAGVLLLRDACGLEGELRHRVSYKVGSSVL